MREAGLVGASHRRGGPVATRRDEAGRPAPDLVDRDFTAEGPNQLRVADITFIPTAAGFLDLAVVLDVWSRKIVGWATAGHLRAELLLDALEMAVGQRRPRGVIHHSDQGSQYTSLAFGRRCREAGIRPSMGPVGDAYDNALCESFLSTLERELLARRRFASRAETRMAVFSHVASSATWRAGTTQRSFTQRWATVHPWPTRRSSDKPSPWNRNQPSPSTVHESGAIPVVHWGRRAIRRPLCCEDGDRAAAWPRTASVNA
jgi:hypothetical protein